MFSINLNRSKSISPAKSIGKFQTSKSANLLITDRTRLYNLPKIPSYYKIDRPMLSQQMKKNIEEKLSLNKTAEISFRKREKNQDFFLKFDKNPFSSSVTNLNMSAPSVQRKVRKTKPQSSFYKKDRIYNTIIEAVNSCRDTSPIVRDRSLKNMKKQRVKMSALIQSDAKKLNYLTKQISQKIVKTQIELQEISLQAILGIEDQNYYLKHQKSINIFACLKAPPKMLDKAILIKNHFNFSSIIQKAEQNIRFPIFRDLSQKARNASIKNKYKKQQILEFITSSDINTDSKKIRFQDMLGLASGRCTPELVSDWIGNRDQGYRYDQNKNDFTIMKENTKNNGLNYAEQEQNLMQIQLWKKNDNPDQDRYAQKCRKINERIEQKMKSKVNLTGKKIIDKATHNVLTEQIKNQILYFLNMDSKVKEKESIRIQGVKNSKITSTKARNLKNNQLITAMKSIKKQFELMEHIGNRTSRM